MTTAIRSGFGGGGDLWGWGGIYGGRSMGLEGVIVGFGGESMGLGPTDVWGWEMCGAETHRSVGRLPFVALQNNP